MFDSIPLNFDHLHLLSIAETKGFVRIWERESPNDGDSRHRPLDYTAAVDLHVGLHHKVHRSQGSRWLRQELPGLDEVRENLGLIFLEKVDGEDKKEEEQGE